MPPDPYKTVSGKEVRVHVGSTGTRFNAEISQTTFDDLVNATRQDFVFQKPDGTQVRKPADAVNPPDGESRVYLDQYGNVTALTIALEYRNTDATLFDVAGTWQIWIEVERTGVYNKAGAPTDLEIYEPGAV